MNYVLHFDLHTSAHTLGTNRSGHGELVWSNASKLSLPLMHAMLSFELVPFRSTRRHTGQAIAPFSCEATHHVRPRQASLRLLPPPLGFGLYTFCCNNCQRCFHREPPWHELPRLGQDGLPPILPGAPGGARRGPARAQPPQHGVMQGRPRTRPVLSVEWLRTPLGQRSHGMQVGLRAKSWRREAKRPKKRSAGRAEKEGSSRARGTAGSCNNSVA